MWKMFRMLPFREWVSVNEAKRMRTRMRLQFRDLVSIELTKGRAILVVEIQTTIIILQKREKFHSRSLFRNNFNNNGTVIRSHQVIRGIQTTIITIHHSLRLHMTIIINNIPTINRINMEIIRIPTTIRINTILLRLRTNPSHQFHRLTSTRTINNNTANQTLRIPITTTTALFQMDRTHIRIPTFIRIIRIRTTSLTITNNHHRRRKDSTITTIINNIHHHHRASPKIIKCITIHRHPATILRNVFEAENSTLFFLFILLLCKYIDLL